MMLTKWLDTLKLVSSYKLRDDTRAEQFSINSKQKGIY